ncbi:unnamed protein product [Timema podura]|uniref:Uncharacterized protein n=1 Tax=Timema podura TaxID=61482 RepID=A0ABN7P528_TIMPD|nr:unnamed protein product [Timema podura]
MPVSTWPACCLKDEEVSSTNLNVHQSRANPASRNNHSTVVRLKFRGHLDFISCGIYFLVHLHMDCRLSCLPSTMLKVWTEEFLSTVTRLDPKFIALHCQEVGGKNYERSMKHVEFFVK